LDPIEQSYQKERTQRIRDRRKCLLVTVPAMERLPHRFHHLRAYQNDNHREQKSPRLEHRRFAQQEKFAMGKLSSQDPPLYQTMPFRHATDHQQREQKKNENEQYTSLLTIFPLPHPCRRKDQQERLQDRPKNYH